MDSIQSPAPQPTRRLRRKAAAEYLNIAPATLAADVCRPRLRIPYVKCGRVVLYDVRDLDAWLASHRVEV